MSMSSSLDVLSSPADALTLIPRGEGFLSLRGVTKQYQQGQPTVNRLDLDLPGGQLLGLLGPSGCGKTTTLRMIAGLMPVTSGAIFIDGQDITHRPPHQRDIGLVFQSYALFPHMTVAQNVAFGLKMRGMMRQEIRDRVQEALESVRMAQFADRKPRHLSGGQQQRVALARALAIQPRLLLLDEPLSNLDAKLRDEMRYEIREIQQKLGITTVLVTHDQIEALTMCDLVGVMHQGRLAQLAPPAAIYEQPQSLFVADFVGRTNVLAGEIVDSRHVRVAGEVYGCAPTQATGRVNALIRPHRIRITSYRDRSLVSLQTNSATGRVADVAYIGDILQYDIDIDGSLLKVEVPTQSGGQQYRQGEPLMCEWLPDDMLIFTEAS